MGSGGGNLDFFFLQNNSFSLPAGSGYQKSQKILNWNKRSFEVNPYLSRALVFEKLIFLSNYFSQSLLNIRTQFLGELLTFRSWLKHHLSRELYALQNKMERIFQNSVQVMRNYRLLKWTHCFDHFQKMYI